MPGAKPQYARDRTFNLHHIKLEIEIDVEKKRIAGSSSLTVSPVTDGLEIIDLDALELTIHGVRLDSGEPLSFDAGDGTVRVRLPQPLAAGRRATVTIDYEGTPRRGLYFVGPDDAYHDKPTQVWTQGQDQDSRYWFPCYDYPNQRATSEVIATVPERFFALSNGRLVETRHDAARKTRTYHWSQEQPHVTYLITLVAGEYVEIADSHDGVPVQYYVPPGREKDARRAMGNTPKMMELFSELTGLAYPWAKYAQITVADFIFGGMENTTATTLTDNALLDERAKIDYSSDPLVAHELAHQWFGDLLTCKDWSHAWLNEGFATYFEALFTERDLGVDEFRYELFRNAGSYVGEDTARYRRSLVTRVYDDPIELFDRHLYEKGCLVLHMLRYVLGDELFFKAVRHYAQKHRDGVVGTEELRQAIEEATGRTMEAFFDQWVYKAGHPDFKVKYSWDDATKLAEVTVTQSQEADGETSIFQMPLVIDFTWEGGFKSFKLELTEKEHRFHLPLDQKPLMMRFDPGNHILKTIEEELPKEMHLYRLAHDDDVIGRVRAAKALAKAGAPDGIAALKRAVLNDGFWGVQAEAARALGSVRSTAAREALLESLSVRHPKARRAVVAALGEFKDEAVAEAVGKLLAAGDESYFVEAEAARTLGKTRSANAFEPLVQALDRDSHMEVIRAATMDGLASLRDERGLEVAKGWAQYGKPEMVRGAALVAVAKLGEEKKETLEFLADFLRDPALRVRLRAAEALENLGDGKAVPALEAQANRELDGRARRRMREAATSVREGAKGKEEANKLREDVDKLAEENKGLRDRLDKLEARLGQQTPEPGSQGTD
ncbi:MAG: M1 family aminopeptidase [Dehalococcoidia bacterium]